VDPPESNWTPDTLKEYIEALLAAERTRVDDHFGAQERAVAAAFTSAQKAVDKAERLADLRAEAQDRMAADRARQQNEWRATIGDLTTTMLGRHEYAIAHSVLVDKMDALQARFDRHEGTATGITAGWGYLIAAIGGVGTLVAITIAIASLT